MVDEGSNSTSVASPVRKNNKQDEKQSIITDRQTRSINKTYIAKHHYHVTKCVFSFIKINIIIVIMNLLITCLYLLLKTKEIDRIHNLKT